MTKAEIAQYLVNLHTLMQAQSSAVHSVPSTVLAAEYDRQWGELKRLISKENTHEARKS